MERLSNRLLSWASLIDEKTIDQARTSSRMPFIYPHLALMPDAHLGLGATVGSVIPTLGAIMPAAVGVDIGCGMIAVRTQFARADLAGTDLGQLRRADRAGGAAVRRRARQPQDRRDRRAARSRSWRTLAEKAELRPGRVRGALAQLQLGHAGIRQPLHRGHRRRDGHGLAVPALRVAGRRQQDRPAPHQGRPAAARSSGGSSCPTRTSPTSSRARRSSTRYIRRAAVGAAVRAAEPGGDDGPGRRPAVGRWLGDARSSEQERINCHHNFTERETHFGKEVWVSRKGAIQADAGQPWADPGLDGHRVVRGRGQGQPAVAELVAARRRPELLAVGGSADVHPRRSCGRRWSASSTATPTRSSTRSRRRTSRSTRSWPTPPTSSTVRHTLRQLVNVKGD